MAALLVVLPLLALWPAGLSAQSEGDINPQTGQPFTQRELYCRRLEQQLATDWQLASQGRDLLPQIERDIRKYDRIYQQRQAELEQRDCYEYFFFSKTLRNNRVCLGLQRDMDDARARLASLEQQRAAATQSRQGGSTGGRRDDLINELARYGCGAQYQQEAQRRASKGPFSFWSDGEEADPGLAPMDGQILPYATYRTVCVRLCDGYYFPISYATLPTSFQKDASQCVSQCAAPTELFVYQNPGSEVEAAVSLEGVPYSELPNAWRYRKEYVYGCSCKLAEYKPDEIPAPGKKRKSSSAAATSTTADASAAKKAVDPDAIQALLDEESKAGEASSGQ
ncbi:MAG: DUF2865 domain-containing protein [Hyphomicrobiaceae bacterium]